MGNQLAAVEASIVVGRKFERGKSMKNLVRSLTLLFLVFVFLMPIACGPVQSAAAEHDKLVDLYYAAVTAKSNYGACADAAVGKMNLLNNTYSMYLSAEVERVNAWRQNVQANKDALQKRLDASKTVAYNDKGVGKKILFPVQTKTTREPNSLQRLDG